MGSVEGGAGGDHGGAGDEGGAGGNDGGCGGVNGGSGDGSGGGGDDKGGQESDTQTRSLSKPQPPSQHMPLSSSSFLHNRLPCAWHSVLASLKVTILVS